MGLKPTVNEVFLFHATSAFMFDEVSVEGFVRETAGFFGKGFYFSDDVRAFPQFTKSGETSCWKVFVTRVCLGTAYMTVSDPWLS